MSDIARWAPEKRGELFRDAYDAIDWKLGEPGIIEKDFWVCWILHRLFGIERHRGNLIFKGGTSLSKVFRAIQRFSEDIDLSIHRQALGFGDDRDPARASSGKQRQKRLVELGNACNTFLRDTLLPELKGSIEEVLGPSAKGDWDLKMDDHARYTLLFRYPASDVTMDADAYIIPEIRLEFGARSDHWPVEERRVAAYATELFSEEFEHAAVNVRTLSVERTFWEKATILHAHHHGGAEKVRPRLSRHYYDTVCLIDNFEDRILERVDLLEVVSRHKESFFYAAWARYDEARSGKLRLAPGDEALIQLLRRDYAAMESMYFEDPPGFDEVITVLEAFEHKLSNLVPA